MSRFGWVVGLVAGALVGCAKQRAPVNDPAAFARPCETDAECAGGVCLGGRCTRACSSGSDCPVAGWTCGPGPLDPAPFCRCFPSSERCDGLDNDCNGVVDDAAAAERSCSLVGGSTCRQGACVCEPPRTGCGGRCVDVSSDPQHCGACDNQCGPGQLCRSGVCACSQLRTLCGEACSDLLSDPRHCGACGHACDAAEPFCRDGRCTASCSPGETRCGDACVDLTVDPFNCGACGRVCPASASGGGLSGGNCQRCVCPVSSCAEPGDRCPDGSQCQAPPEICWQGACVDVSTVATVQSRSLAADADALYWSTSTEVVRFDKAAATTTTLVSDVLADSLASDGTSLFFMRAQELWTVPLNGDGPRMLKEWPESVRQIIPDGRDVILHLQRGRVLRWPRGGGATLTLASDQGISSPTLRNGTLYWTNPGSGELLRMPAAGGEVVTLARLLEAIGGLAVDDVAAYLAVRDEPERGSGAIVAVPFDGRAPFVLAGNRMNPSQVTSDGTWVYWVDNHASQLRTRRQGGGAVVTLVPGLPNGLAALSTSADELYWLAGRNVVTAPRAASGP